MSEPSILLYPPVMPGMSESEPRPVVDEEHPWLGLEPFTEATQRFFFGRDEEVRELFVRVRDQPLTILYGQSGLGKTSLLGAGLIPKLRVENFRPVVLRFRFALADPPLLEQVRSALALACADDPIAVEDRQTLWRYSTLWETLHHMRLRPTDLDKRPPVLIFDMFEELFTHGRDPSRKDEVDELFLQLADFIENRPPADVQERLNSYPGLAYKLDFEPLTLRLVIALREDYLAPLEAWKKAIPSIMHNRMALHRLSGSQALAAVVQPGRLVTCAQPGDIQSARNLVSDEVGAQIVRFVAKPPDGTPLEEMEAEPPLLSLLCEGLNRMRLELDMPSFSEDLVVNQSKDILQDFYKRSFDGCPPAVRRYVEDEMVTPRGHRNSVARDSAEDRLHKENVENPERWLDQLLRRRLLNAEECGGHQRLEITHDILAPIAMKSREEREERERKDQAERQERERAAAERQERERVEMECQQAEREKRRFKRLAAIMGALVLLLICALIHAIRASKQARQAQLRSEQLTQSAKARSAALKFQLLEAARSDQVSAQNMGRQRRMGDAAAYLARALSYDPRMSAATKIWVGGEPLLNTDSENDSSSLVSAEMGGYLFNDWEVHLPTYILTGSKSKLSFPLFSPDGKRVVVICHDNTALVYDAHQGTRLSVLQGHRSGITSARFSPDSQRIVTASDDKTARVWEASSGTLLSTLEGHDAALSCARFSPDGRSVLTASLDMSARVWEAAGKIPPTILQGHGGTLLDACFSPNGKRVLTASEDKSACVWDAESGKVLVTLEGHETAVTSAQFSPDGRQALTCCDGANVRVWDAATGLLLAVLRGHAAPVTSAQFSPDGQLIVASCGDKSAKIWEASTGKLRGEFRGHDGPVTTAEFSPDGLRVLTASGDHTARIWDVASGSPVAVLQGHQDGVLGARFSADGQLILTASADMTARLWEAVGSKLMGALHGHEATIKSAQFSPDGQRIVTASRDATAKVWEVASGRLLTSLDGHKLSVVSARFSPDGERIVTASSDKTARLWESHSGKLLTTLAGHTDALFSARFSPDGQCVVTSGWDNTAMLWAVSDGALLSTLFGHDDWVGNAQFSPDGMFILTSSEDKTARLWQAPGGTPLVVFRGHQKALSGAQFSPDGRHILTASWDNTARVWDAAHGSLTLPILEHEAPLTSAQFSPDGQHILTASGDKTARLWDRNGGRLMATLHGHEGSIRSAQFGSDGEQIITASDDTTARVWEARGGKLLGILASHGAPVSSAQFSPDNRCVLTVSEERIARVWEAPAFLGAPPQWFADFFRLLGQRTINADGELVNLAPADWLELRERVRSCANADPSRYGEMARWFLTPCRQRPIRPGCVMTQAEVADQLITPAASEWEVRRAYELDPTHPLVHLALARFERNPVTAEFLRHYDLGRLLQETPAAMRERAQKLLEK